MSLAESLVDVEAVLNYGFSFEMAMVRTEKRARDKKASPQNTGQNEDRRALSVHSHPGSCEAAQSKEQVPKWKT